MGDGTCSIDGCGRPHRSRGYCEKHYRRVWKHGTPDLVRPGTFGEPGPSAPNWVGNSAGYSAVHLRLKQERGRAALHQCRHCQRRAEEWAYDHEDPNPRREARSGRPYSANLDRYFPLCKSCHGLFDGQFAEPATTCQRGHPWNEENTRILTDGRRRCRACMKQRTRERWRLKRQDSKP